MELNFIYESQLKTTFRHAETFLHTFYSSFFVSLARLGCTTIVKWPGNNDDDDDNNNNNSNNMMYCYCTVTRRGTNEDTWKR
jgi:hypothetical protein